MTELNKLSPSKILSMSVDYPETLYKGDTQEEVKKIYRKLSSLWHPDKHIVDKVDTNPVFSHIKLLYENALKKIANGTWNAGQVILLEGIDGKKYQVRYQSVFPSDLGQCYVSSNFVTYIVDKENEDLMMRGVKAITNLKFANDKMKLAINPLLPGIHSKIETATSHVIVLKKKSEFLALKDVIRHFDGKVPLKHAAWIVSSMYNLACFIEYNNLMHGGFSIDNYFIHPANHEGALLGGWWFAHQLDEKLVALNKEALSVAPIKIMNTKKAGKGLDLELIKLCAKQLLGDPSGIYLAKDKTIPKPIIDFLRDGSGNNAVKEYAAWHEALIKSFGARRFTEMVLTENDIYSKGD